MDPSATSSSQNTKRPSPTGPPLQVVIDDVFWSRINGKPRLLKVRFLNGRKTEQRVIRDCVEPTYNKIPMAIRFEFLEAHDCGPSDIRMDLVSSESWSMLGRGAEKYSKENKATMYLNLRGTVPDGMSREEMQRSTILHEFGHALGMEHEHQRPDSGIIWNDAELLEQYMQNYDRVRQCYRPIRDRRAMLMPYDPKSIMHYPVCPLETLNLLEPVEPNTSLSETDELFLMLVYPLSFTESVWWFTEWPRLLRAYILRSLSTGLVCR